MLIFLNKFFLIKQKNLIRNNIFLIKKKTVFNKYILFKKNNFYYLVYNLILSKKNIYFILPKKFVNLQNKINNFFCNNKINCFLLLTKKKFNNNYIPYIYITDSNPNKKFINYYFNNSYLNVFFFLNFFIYLWNIINNLSLKKKKYNYLNKKIKLN